MQKVSISKDWLLKAPGSNDWQTVDIPNDYSICQPRDINAPGGSSNGFFQGGFARYVKYLKFEEAAHVILDVDGAYMCSEVKLNDEFVGLHPHGYTPYLMELTGKIRPGRTNKLEIDTNDNQPSTRWYSGAGLYRDVNLWTGGEVRVEPWDVFINTVSIGDEQAVVSVSYEISADLDGEAVIAASTAGASKSVTVAVKAGEKTKAEVRLEIPNPALWSMDTPNLYTLHTEITLDGKVTDTADNSFGIRTISADARNGLLLNGKSVKLRGGCIHHDQGVLGAADFPAAADRKLRLLKEAGFNAIRSAHNPPSLAVLEACDRLGIVLMDEAFDMWNCKMTSGDYHLWFADWYARDIACMVRRDRNHPCVFSYSIGNEVTERDGSSDGAKWSRILAEEIRKHDNTKFVTSGICGVWYRPESIDPPDYQEDSKARFQPRDGVDENNFAAQTEGVMAPLDIVGYNYQWKRYQSDHERYPDRVIWGSETHALDFYDSWQAVLENDHVLGDFTWTAYDNLGEVGTGRFCWARDGFIPGINHGPYPWRTCYQGDLDLCGYRRPQSYFREAVWIGGTEPKIFTTHPEHYGEGFSGTHWHWYDVHETWTFDDAYLGKPVKAEVYTDADEIRWFLNGRELGSSKPEKGIATMDVLYEKGILAVKAVKNGEIVGESSLHTLGNPVQIQVEPEKTAFTADNRDLCYFRITIQDENGDRVTEAGNELTCLVDGGELMGIFSGDPANEDIYGSNRCHAFDGRALVIVRTKHPGQVTVTVGAAGLRSDSAAVTAK